MKEVGSNAFCIKNNILQIFSYDKCRGILLFFSTIRELFFFLFAVFHSCLLALLREMNYCNKILTNVSTNSSYYSSNN